MASPSRQAGLAIPAILAIGAALAWAGSQEGIRLAGLPLFALCGAIAFATNAIAFLPAYVFQTERYFDLTGSLTYLTLVGVAWTLGTGDARADLLAALVGVWALRLGSFLFLRISHEGGDGRFDRIKPDFARFLMAWTLQGLWVFLTISCGLAAMTSSRSLPLGGWAALGSGVWLAGFVTEVVADEQKRRFRRDPARAGRFITTGLWAWSRHPNYFGEILIWIGVALVAWPSLAGARLVTLISPVFVYVLLTRISGIPLLEARAQRRWGDDPDYQAYVAATPPLLPRPPRRRA